MSGTILREKLSRGFTHLRQRTLLKRLQWQWHDYLKQRRLEWWNSQVDKRKKIETRIQQGVKMHLYFDSKLSQLIFCHEFELEERHFLNAFLRRGDIFVDVGANMGLFTLIAAHRVGENGRVYSFEPTFEICRRLIQNIKLNNLNNVCSRQLALSDVESEGLLFQSQDGYDAWNSFAKPIAGETYIKETVQCKRWDDFARDNQLLGNVTMMKVDVEGWEARVLNGACEMLSKKDAPVLLVEFTEEAARSAGSSCKELYCLLEEFGYQMYTYHPKFRTIVPDPLRDSYPYVNLIATKDPHYIHNRLRKKSFWR
ncbi:MAG: FkbM family methyltransferase [Desulfobacterales bacterium]|uniref:FkbM family methyltransferase n=1 Tax=Candidatus Desulfatibia vada TaxID=2841696 RepID=A0A8J6NXH1_9BACT|nr:FkbM family methyltransferase [Candidatus Desulfatibia vada]